MIWKKNLRAKISIFGVIEFLLEIRASPKRLSILSQSSIFEVSMCSFPKAKLQILILKLFVIYSMVLIFAIININP